MGRSSGGVDVEIVLEAGVKKAEDRWESDRCLVVGGGGGL